MRELRDRVAVVTGGASGIGLGIVTALAAEGARVAMLDLRADHLAEAQARLAAPAHAGRIAAFEVDVSDRDAMATVAAQVVARFGRVDILVNNAGVGIQREWRRVTAADWDFGLQVNLSGVINGIMAYEPMLRANRHGGHIVNTASLAGLASVPAAMAIYGTTKAAVVALSEALAPELRAAGIGVTILCPGLVRSNIADIDHTRPPRFRPTVPDRDATPEDADRAASTEWLEPDAVGRMVIDAIRDDTFYLITHATHRDKFVARTEAILAAWPES